MLVTSSYVLTILSQSSPSDKKFEDAIGYYSRAIELNPNVAVYYGNRSFAYLKMESYGYALIDASKALELDRTYIKVRCSLSVLVFFFFSICKIEQCMMPVVPRG